MYAILNAKTTLFMAEQARYGDLDARKELAWLLVKRGDCRFRDQFPECTASFTAEVIAKYSMISEEMHPPPGPSTLEGLSRLKYWCPILQDEGYMLKDKQIQRSAIHIFPKELRMRGWVLTFGEPGSLFGSLGTGFSWTKS